MLSLTIDRTSLGLEPLVLPGGGFGPIVLESIDRPHFRVRKTQAPPSPHMGGRQTLAAVREQDQIVCALHVFGSSTANRVALEDELEEALFQFAFDVTLTVDGVATTFLADPSTPDWGELLHLEVRSFESRAVVTIPVNPAGA